MFNAVVTIMVSARPKGGGPRSRDNKGTRTLEGQGFLSVTQAVIPCENRTVSGAPILQPCHWHWAAGMQQLRLNDNQ